MIGASGMPLLRATSTASRVSTKVGLPPSWKVSTICTTSFLPRSSKASGASSWRMSSQAGVLWRRPRGSWPMFGAPPKPASRQSHRGGMTVAIDLQGRADKQVHRVLPGQLAEHPVGPQRAVAPGEEHVGTSRDVVFHPQLGAEAMHAFDPAAFNGRDQGWVRVEGPVAADLAFEAEGFAVGRQDQFDGGGVETDAVVQ